MAPKDVVIALVVAVELSSVFWFAVDRAARWWIASKGNPEKGKAFSLALTNAVFDIALGLYGNATTIASFLLQNAFVILAVIAFALLGVVVTDHGPAAIQAVDTAWERIYPVTIEPVKEVINVGRLVADSVLGV